MMHRIFVLVALAVALALPAQADSRTQLLRSVDGPMQLYFPEVEPESLSTSQLARIYAILHGSGSANDKQQHIRSVLGGRYSLLGTLGIQLGWRRTSD